MGKRASSIVGLTFGTLRVDREGPPTARRQCRVYCTCMRCNRTDLLIRRDDLMRGATSSCGQPDCKALAKAAETNDYRTQLIFVRTAVIDRRGTSTSFGRKA